MPALRLIEYGVCAKCEQERKLAASGCCGRCAIAYTPSSRRIDLALTSEAYSALAYWSRELDDPGFVYYVQGENGGPVKIGRAGYPYERLRELQVGNHERLVIRALLLGWEEAERHRQNEWHHALVRGEWYGMGLDAGGGDLHHIAHILPFSVYEEARKAA